LPDATPLADRRVQELLLNAMEHGAGFDAEKVARSPPPEPNARSFTTFMIETH
jgi:hypothetical protein